MPLLPQWCADYFQPQSLDGFEKLISTIKSEYLIIRRWVDSLKKVLIIELINLGQAHKFGWKAANWTWNSSHHHSLFVARLWAHVACVEFKTIEIYKMVTIHWK